MRPTLLCVLILAGSLCACSNGAQRIADVTFYADFGTPEDADVQVRNLADRTGLELRDTMVGVDGYRNFLLGNREAVILIAPNFDCTRPNATSYLMKISITPDSLVDEAPVATAELVRDFFSTAIRAEEDLPEC